VNVAKGIYHSAIYFGLTYQDWESYAGRPANINPNIHHNIVCQSSTVNRPMIEIRYSTDLKGMSALDGKPTMNNNCYYIASKNALFSDNRPGSILSNARLTAWQSHIGGDSGSLEVNPSLDADYLATNPQCVGMGIPYALIVTDMPGTGGTEPGTPAPDLSGLYTIGTQSVPSRVLDIQWASTEVGAYAQLWNYNYTPAQRFRIQKVETIGTTNYYTITNVWSGKCLDVQFANVAQGTLIWQYTSNGTNAQRFSIDANPNGGYWISPKGSNLVFDLQWGGTSAGTLIHLWEKNNTSAQRFTLNPIEPAIANGVYSLTALASGKSLDAQWGGTTPMTPFHLWTPNDTAAQRFRFTYNTNTGYYVITQASTGLAVDVVGASAASGAYVWLYTSNNTKAQMWTIVRNSNGSYTLINACGGMALDAQWGGTTDGTRIWVYDINNTNAQRWNIKTMA